MAKDEIIPLLLIGGVGFLVYEYFTGASWLTNLLPSSTPSTNSNSQQSYSGPPPLGTVVPDSNSISAQANAGMAYILPSQTIPNVNSLVPNGYSILNTTDYGQIFVRNNIFGAIQTVLQNRVARATSQGVPLSQVQTTISLTDVNIIMSTQGLSGVSGIRTGMGTSVFPIDGGYGVAGLGKIVHINPYKTPPNYQVMTSAWERLQKS